MDKTVPIFSPATPRSSSSALGIRSAKETLSITPAANPKETVTNRSLFLLAAKITTAPSKVANPDAMDSPRAKNIRSMVNSSFRQGIRPE